MCEDTPSQGPDRRSVLKKAGIAGVAVWSAPAITTLTSPAFAQGSPPVVGPDDTGGVCAPLTRRVQTVQVDLTLASANNQLEFGLQGPGGGTVCTDCDSQPGASATFGPFDAGETLTFYMKDFGLGCGQPGCEFTFTCDDTQHSRVSGSGNSYLIEFRDAGCECNPAGTSITEGSNLKATITFT
jgi:hypothetical protein